MVFLLRFCVVLLTAGLVACGSGSTRVSEKPIPPATLLPAALTPSKPSMQPVGPPTTDEVQQAVRRVFGEDVVLLDHENPFIVGDFNGDGSQDLMARVKAVPARLADINNELANWTIENPLTAYVPPQHQKVVRMPPVPKTEQVRAGEILLAVIHGYGNAGWRDRLARQAYLLRAAAGSSPTVQQPSPGLLHDFGIFPSPRQVLAEDLGGRHGVLYWTGATYAWHHEK